MSLGQTINQPSVGDHVMISDGENAEEFYITDVEDGVLYIQSLSDPDSNSSLEYVGWKVRGTDAPYSISFTPGQSSTLDLPPAEPPVRSFSRPREEIIVEEEVVTPVARSPPKIRVTTPGGSVVSPVRPVSRVQSPVSPVRPASHVRSPTRTAASPVRSTVSPVRSPGRTVVSSRAPSRPTVSSARSPVKSPERTAVRSPLTRPKSPVREEILLPEVLETVVEEEEIVTPTVQRAPNGTAYGRSCVISLVGRSGEDRYDSGLINGNIRFYAVYDGHGGKRTADLLKEHFPQALAEGLIGVDMNSLEDVRMNVQMIIDNFEREILLGKVEDGSTMTLALITEKYIYLVNLGDSRGILFNDLLAMYPPSYEHAQIVGETIDHEPSRERARVEEAGGRVLNIQGTHRVNGTLAVARSFGDFYLKDIKGEYSNRGPVSLEADVEQYLINPSNPDMKPLFLLLATDGLFENVYQAQEATSQEMVDMAVERFTMSGTPIRELRSATILPRNKEEQDILRSCKRLAEAARTRASDDITVMIVKI